MGTLAEYGTAAEFRDIIRTIVDERISKTRPAGRIAEVVQINALQLTASVKFAGDEGAFNARFGLSMVPRAVGNIVRVSGAPGNYWITEILNDTGVHQAYEPIKEAVDSGIIPTVSTVDQKISVVEQAIQDDIVIINQSITDGDTANQNYINQQITGVQTGVNNAIKGYVNEYYVSTSETALAGGSWSTTQPTRTAGTFIWFRTIVTRGDNSTATTTPALLTGNAGAPGGAGTPAPLIVLTATTQALIVPASGGATTPATATITGTALNTTIDTYEYSVDGGNFTTTVPAGVSRSTNVVTITGATMTARTIAVRMRNAATAAATDTITVAKVADGPTGVGVSGTTITYGKNTSAVTPPASFTGTIPSTVAGEYLWTRTVTNYSDGSSNAATPAYSVAAHGATGGPGSAGKGITGTVITYAKNTSGSTAPASGSFTSSIPTTVAGEFLWTRTVMSFTDSTSVESFSVAAHGATGTAGRGISTTTVTYAKNTSGTTPPSVGSFVASPIPTTTTGEFLWTRTYTTYTDALNPTESFSVSAHGATGGTGRGISSTAVEYAKNTSGTTAPTTGWVTTPIPATVAGEFLWSRTVITYTSGTPTTTTTHSVSAHGATGNAGADAYTILFSNEAMTFPGSTTAALGGSETTGVTGYKGGTQQSISLGTPTFLTGGSTTQPAGLTVGVTGSPGTAPVVTVTVTTALTAQNGTITYPVVIDGKTFSKVISWSVSRQGSQGNPGNPGRGISSTSITYAKSTNGTTAPAAGSFTTTIPATVTGEFLWTKTELTYTDATKDTAYSVSAHGATGGPGSAGRGITGTTVTYAVSTDGVNPPSTGWSGTIPTTTPGQYLWTKTDTAYTSAPLNVLSYSVAKHGTSGEPGDDGVGIASTTVNYAKSTSGVTAPSTGWVASPIPATIAGEFLWTRTVTNYTDNTSNAASPAYSVAAHGASGSDGKGISGTVVEYTKSTSGTAIPSTGWVTTPIPATVAGEFLWTRTVVSYTTGSPSTSYSVAAHGGTGGPGADAPTITSIQTYYLQTTDPAGQPSKPTASVPPGWITTQPAWAANTKLWRTDRVGFSNGAFTYTDVAQDQSYAAALFATTAANGKNSVTHSQAAPGTTANTVGDTWFQYIDAPLTKLTRVWRGAGGTSWTQGTMDTTIIPLLDIGIATFGTMSGNRIQTQTMQVDRLLVSSFDNLLSDSQFVTPLTDTSATWQNQTYSSIVAGAGRVTSQPALRITNTAAQNFMYNLPYDMNKIEQGQWLRLNCFVKSSVAASANTINMVVRWKSITGTFTYSTVTYRNSSGTALSHSAGVWNLMEGKVQAPSNTDSWSLYLETTSGLSTGTTDFYEPRVTRAASSELIVDGAIRAIHVTADMVNGLIVTGGVLQTNQNGPIYGTTNTGIKMTTTGLVAYNTSGVPTFTLSASDGSVSMKGTLESGSAVTGATITASTTGVIQTESTANRGIKMTSSALTAYSATGSPTFTMLASDGSVTMTGGLISGGYVAGATFSTKAGTNAGNVGSNSLGNRVQIREVSGGGVVEFWTGNTLSAIPGTALGATDTQGVDGATRGRLRITPPNSNVNVPFLELATYLSGGALYNDYARLKADGIVLEGGGMGTEISGSGGLKVNQGGMLLTGGLSMNGGGTLAMLGGWITNVPRIENTAGDVVINVANGIGRLSSGSNIKFRVGTNAGTGTSTAIIFTDSLVAATHDTMNASSPNSSNTKPFYAQTIYGFGAYQNASDRREKNNIEDVSGEEAVGILKGTRIRSFTMNNSRDGRKEYGVIAQEQVNVLPSAVTRMNPDDDKSIYGLSYQDLWAVGFRAQQEMLRRIEELEAQLAAS